MENECNNPMENNTSYHYVYKRPEPVNGTAAPTMKPVKKHGEKKWMKLIALVLVCTILGGAAGAGIVTLAGRSGSGTKIAVSDRTVSEVELMKVDGKTEMTAAESYAANVNSVVSINTTSTTNVFGYTTESASAGSGFIVTTDGYIVTNYHVINGASTVKVTLYNGESYDATVIGGDEDYDVAVLKIDAANLQAVTLGDSDKLNVGDVVTAIGNPLGELTFSQTEGIVSSCNRAINVDGTPFNMIQIDASINPGNSGGPLLNNYGEVIGIVSAKYSSYASTTVEGLGFAIPINDVVAMVQDIMENGYVTDKAYLGISAYTVNSSYVQMYSNLLTEGVYVASVDKGGAAEQAGLQEGDIIVKLADQTVTSMSDLTAAKKSYRAGDTAEITVYRGGEEKTLSITFGSQPASSDTAEDSTQNSTQDNSQNGGSQNPYQDYFNYFFGGNSGNSSGSGSGSASGDAAA